MVSEGFFWFGEDWWSGEVIYLYRGVGRWMGDRGKEKFHMFTEFTEDVFGCCVYFYDWLELFPAL